MMRRKDAVAVCNDSGAEVEHNHHVKEIAYLFLFSMIALDLLSMSVLTLTANAQPSSYSISVANTNNTNTGSASGVTQMGICEVGAGGPCNNDIQ